ncbi:uncharacterized protein LOC111696916 [Eurytemora carolleeae]|uniref:uncharacterized protein LOC111696916 n=1 Tax=Eurytemora carolleeae TaxID=1294199 RepID=UPI000C7802C8|nr:uncharacterized protein LOC111696916 [Eurytemora carolleeae]|eukprot:XP_023322475.1 uncharacterized protein LOC111696916 [Eurytemora affinis]
MDPQIFAHLDRGIQKVVDPIISMPFNAAPRQCYSTAWFPVLLHPRPRILIKPFSIFNTGNRFLGERMDKWKFCFCIGILTGYWIGVCMGAGAGRHIGHKLRVGGEPGRFTEYSQVKTPYTEDWNDNRTMEWYAGKKGAKITKASHFDYEYVLGHKISQYWRGKHRIKSKMEIDPATQEH